MYEYWNIVKILSNDIKWKNKFLDNLAIGRVQLNLKINSIIYTVNYLKCKFL